MIKILYVEDNEDNAYLVKMRLELLGDIEVEIAPNGRSGVAMARANRPDLILMDMDLPDISGTETMRILKSDPHTRLIPIIALTAHAMEGTKERALSEGFDEYCAKPIEFPSLEGVIKNCITQT